MLKKILGCMFLAMLVLVVGCSSSKKNEKKVEDKKPMVGVLGTFKDGLGYTVTVDSMKRVGVCSGSLAHLWQLAGGSITAATDDVFNYKPVSLSAQTINIGDLKRVNVEQILDSNLDFIILSATIPGHEKIRDTLEKAGITTAYFEIESFEEYLNVLHIMTSLTGRDDLYQMNGLKVQEEVKMQIERKNSSHPKILLLQALSTKIKVQDSSTMTGNMLKDLGCVNVADNDKTLLSSLSLEAILKENPEYVFITIMGEEEQAKQLIQKTIYEDPAWSNLNAITEKHCYILSKDLFHYKPNQRWGESYRTLADLLNYEKN